jgi:hypothetical protein
VAATILSPICCSPYALTSFPGLGHNVRRSQSFHLIGAAPPLEPLTTYSSSA